jgi:hypothetical protein
MLSRRARTYQAFAVGVLPRPDVHTQDGGCVELAATAAVIFLSAVLPLALILGPSFVDHVFQRRALEQSGVRLTKKSFMRATGELDVGGKIARFELCANPGRAYAEVVFGKADPSNAKLRYDFQTQQAVAGDADRAFVLLEAGLLDLANNNDAVELYDGGIRLERRELDETGAEELVELARRLCEVVELERTIGDSAEAALLSGTRHRDDGLRHQSLRRLLARFPRSAEAAIAIAERRRDADPRIRLTAALIGDPDLAVIRALALEETAPEDVNRKAMHAFAARAGDDEVCALLIAILDRPQARALHADAARLLGKHAPSAVLIEVATRASFEAIPMLVRALAQNEADLAACLVALLHHAEESVCTIAIDELARLGSDIAVAELRRLSNDARASMITRAEARAAVAAIFDGRGYGAGALSLAELDVPQGRVSLANEAGRVSLSDDASRE